MHCCHPTQKFGPKSLFHVAAGCLTIPVADARSLASWPHGGLMRSFCGRLQGIQDPAVHRSCVGTFEISGVQTKEGQDPYWRLRGMNTYPCFALFVRQSTAQNSPGPMIHICHSWRLFWRGASRQVSVILWQDPH